MSFTPLIQIEHSHSHSHHHSSDKTHDNSDTHTHSSIHIILSDGKRGCENCTLHDIKGIKKILGKVRGKKIMIWAQSPGKVENSKGEELIGPAGKFLWQELKRVHIKREDCDIQNVVRCMPADKDDSVWPPFRARTNIAKEEIKCCSVYNEKALTKSKAKLHLIFGQIAGSVLLKKEFTPQSKRVFYSDNMHGWVVYLDHPSFFLHQGYGVGSDKKPNDSLNRFRDDLNKAKQLLKKQSFDKYGFLKEQKYIGVVDSKTAIKVYRYLREKKNLVYDMESGQVNKHGRSDDNGKNIALCCGFAAEPGTSYTFALARYGDVPISRRCVRLNVKLVKKLLRNKAIKKSAHYGVSDSNAAEDYLNIKVEGYDYDTLLGEYFRDPDAKAYGLEAISMRRYPDFMGYKDIRWPDAFTHEYKKKILGKKIAVEKAGEVAEQTKKMNLARLPWKKMVLYNGADCHLELLVDKSTRKYVNQPLMDAYRDASFILHQMEVDKNCRPLFDYDWNKQLKKLYPLISQRIERKLRHKAGKYAIVPIKKGKIPTGEYKKVKFNPGSPDHINWLIYTKWHIPVGPEGKNTQKGTLKRLAIKYPKVAIVPIYRAAKKVESTYLDSVRACADLNEGHPRTNWKMTGTGTGRLASGADKDKKNLKVMNFQNIHGDPLIKCQFISDIRWRKLYEYWKKFGDFTKKTWQKFKNLYVQLGFDFSQNELREVAEESLDVELCKMFASKKLWHCHKSKGGCGQWHTPDPHVEVGHELTGWAREIIAHDDRVRRVIKNMQFGIVFGLQGEGLYRYVIALGAKTTRHEVDKFHKKYFRRFPKVRNLQDRYRKFVEKHKYVINPYGFRRNVNVDEQKRAEEAGEEREGGWWGNVAINTPIQSAAHHFLTFAIAMLKRKPKRYRKLKYPQMEIHDALYFRVRLYLMLKAAILGHKLMVDEPMRISEEEFGIKKTVPLATKPKAGFRFGVHVEGIGKGELATEWGFLNAWCRENRKLEHSFRKQLKKARQALGLN